MQKPSLILFDLDGVLRHFSVAIPQQVEKNYGLQAGILPLIAFSSGLLTAVTTGQITKQQWIEKVGDKVGNPQAAHDWFQDSGTIDTQMVTLIRKLRNAGYKTAILTNGTDTIRDEIEAFNLSQYFDAIFTTNEIGYAKPSPRAYQHVCEKLNLEPNKIVFIDDKASNIAGAEAVGFTGHLFRNVETLQKFLATKAILNAT